MYSNIIANIRKEICNELRSRVNGNVFTFRHVDEDGEEQVYCDISVGFPDEIGYFPDVVQVWCGTDKEVYVAVRDSHGEDRNISITNVELSTAELASILDAIIDREAVIME